MTAKHAISAQIQDHYSKPLVKGLTSYNKQIEQLTAERATITAERGKLDNDVMNASYAGKGFLQDILNIKNRASLLDMKELGLLMAKAELQAELTKSQNDERDRFNDLETKRRAELEKAFEAAGADSTHKQGMLNGDSKVMEFRNAARAIDRTKKIMTAADIECIEYLKGELKAALNI